MEQEFELIAKTFMGLEPVWLKSSPSWVPIMYRSVAAWCLSQATRK